MQPKHKVNHGAIRSAAANHAHIKKHSGKTTKESKRPLVVRQYAVVVRNNIGQKRGTSKTYAKRRTIRARPVVHRRHISGSRQTRVNINVNTPSAATAAAKAIGAPNSMSSEFASLSLTSPVATVSPVTDANGAVTMNVLPGSAVPWPPLPEETLVPEPEPITDEDKKIRIVNDRQKQLQYAQQRQERANYLESQINIAAQHGYIIDPAEIQRRRKEISAIGVNDPSTKRAAALIDSTILLKKDKPSHMQRNFNLLVAMVVILVFVGLITRGNNETSEEKTKRLEEKDKSKGGNDSGSRKPVSVGVGGIAIIVTLIAAAISYGEWNEGAKAPGGKNKETKENEDGIKKRNGFTSVFKAFKGRIESFRNKEGDAAKTKGLGGMLFHNQLDQQQQ